MPRVQFTRVGGTASSTETDFGASGGVAVETEGGFGFGVAFDVIIEADILAPADNASRLGLGAYVFYALPFVFGSAPLRQPRHVRPNDIGERRRHQTEQQHLHSALQPPRSGDQRPQRLAKPRIHTVRAGSEAPDTPATTANVVMIPSLAP